MNFFQYLIIISSLLYQDIDKVKPIKNLMEMEWTIKMEEDDYVIPVIIEDKFYVKNKGWFDVRTGMRSQLKHDNSDTLLIFNTDAKLLIYDLRNDTLIIDSNRRRNFYIDNENLKISSDPKNLEVYNENEVHLIDYITGKQYWIYKAPGNIYNQPISYKGKVYVASEDEIIILDESSGSLINKISTGGICHSGLVINQDKLYALIEKRGLLVYDLDNLNLIWEFKLDRYTGHLNQLTFNEQSIFLYNYSLYSLNKTTGEREWAFNFGNGIYPSRSDIITAVNDYLIFYIKEDNEVLLAGLKNGILEYKGKNSGIISSKDIDDQEEIDLLHLKFFKSSIDNEYLIGILGDKIYGFRLKGS